MWIEYVHPSPKAGKREEIFDSTAELLILAGFAQKIDPNAPPQLAVGSAACPWTATPTWGIGMTGGGEHCIIFRKDAETWTYRTPPAECPSEIAKQFVKLTGRELKARQIAAEQKSEMETQQLQARERQRLW